MKKILIVILIATAVSVLFLLKFKDEETTKVFKQDELSKIGYNIDEINLINSTLDQSSINIILEHQYINNLKDILDNPDFKKENLDSYLELMNNTDLNVQEIIYIINNDYYVTGITYNDKVVEIIKNKYCIKDYLKRYVNYYNKNTDLDINKVISNVNANLDYEYYTNTSSVDLSKGNLVLVNKYYKLDKNYVPDDLVTIESKYGNTRQMKKEAYEAFKIMFEAAKKDGLHFYIASPYRSYSYQQTLYNNYVKSDGKKNADTYSARPGYSEHQTGLAVDLMATGTTTLNEFGGTKEYEWLIKNAHKYGFILRYPKDKEDITGYIYEPWHYRYLGVDIATKVYESGLTYDEYYAYYIR